MVSQSHYLIIIICLILSFLSCDLVLANEIGVVRPNSFAWSDNYGWIQFSANRGSLKVRDDSVVGYAWIPNGGWLNLSPDNGGVKNDGEGNLSGSAWGQNVGWVDFDGVSINSEGLFRGVAYGDVIGSLSFDCGQCLVLTDWRARSIRSSWATATPFISSSSQPVPILVVSPKPKVSDSQREREAPIIEPKPDVNKDDKKPKFLFDIRLELDQRVYKSMREFEARVTLDSFGTEPTPIKMDFKIKNSQGKVIATKTNNTIVETRDVFTVYFSEMLLGDGKYTIHLTTNYGDNVVDEFYQEFEIYSGENTLSYTMLFFGLTVSLIIIAVIFYIVKSLRMN